MRTSLIAALIAGAFVSLHAQAADLLQVYQQALANDAQYASARAALTAGQEKAPQGRAGVLPTVTLSGGYNRSGLDSTQSGITANTEFSGNSYTLALSQPLFRWANWELYQQGKLQVAASEAQFAQAQQDLIVRVSQAYFDVLAAQDVLASVQAQKIAITEQLASAKRNFEVGTATITDTHEAQAAYDLVVAQEFAAVNDLEVKRTALQALIGTAPGALATLKPGVALTPPQPTAMEPWVSSAETANFGVVGAELNLASAKRDIARNRAGHYPTLDLVAQQPHSHVDGQSNNSGSASN